MLLHIKKVSNGKSEIISFVVKFRSYRPVLSNSRWISRYEADIAIYPAMTAFTDQYSLPNIFFDIGQL